MRAVDEVLEEIGAGEKPRLLVLNKADLLDEDERREVELAPPRRRCWSRRSPARASTPCASGSRRPSRRPWPRSSCSSPTPQGGRLHELHEVAGDLERTDREDGVLVHAKVPVAELHRFDDLAVV